MHNAVSCGQFSGAIDTLPEAIFGANRSRTPTYSHYLSSLMSHFETSSQNFRSTLAKVEGIIDVAALSTLKKALWYKSEFRKELNLSKPLTIRDALHRASDNVSHEEEMELLAKRHEPSKQTPHIDKSQPSAPNHKKGAQGGTFVHHEGRNFSGAHNYQADTP